MVEKTAALLNRREFSGFSMSAMMEATGLEKGGIYRHFDSKEQLASEACEYAWQAALGTRMRDLESISNSLSGIANYGSSRALHAEAGLSLFSTFLALRLF
jgi:TetR/AcrR family transcriptional repressor of nem operon